MSRRLVGAALAVLASLAVATPAQAESTGLNAYRVKATAKNLEKLALAGFDVTEGRRNGYIEIYATSGQVKRFTRETNIRSRLITDRRGRTSVERSTRRVRAGQRELDLRARAANHGNPTAGASDAGYKVWRKYDPVAGDGKEQYVEAYNRIVSQHPGITAKVDIGTTEWHRDIWAIQVTKGATGADNNKPAVLYNSMQHAREWLAGETCMRSLDYFVSNYGKDARVTRLVDTRQLWFVCVNNPDGYEFTFTPGNRLWRKNLREQNGQAGIQTGDGVDPNRNFPVNWGLDDEGSSQDLASETYRGPFPYAPEPETVAMQKLWDMVDFAFQKNDHTAAALLLYPQGWQQYTPTADDPIFRALAGDDEDPGIATFDPDLGAELYITNGDTLDTAYNREGILAYTPEGSEPTDKTVSGFEFEDNEGAIDNEFKRHLPFVIDLAESADDPEDVDSHLGNTVEDFYVDAFADSYGTPQTVQVLAKRSLGAVRLKYQIAGGAVQTATTSEWDEGERYYQEDGVEYHRLRGTVQGGAKDQSVKVWFEANGGKVSPSFTYTIREATSRKVLVLAAEDYTGPTPTYTPAAPKYLSRYTSALAAAGFPADVYDVDARGRRAPHPLGVLSHYDAVVWYTGDDYLTREPGQVPGTGTSRLALDMVVNVRDYLNEGGKVVHAGRHAGQQYFEGYEFRNAGYPQPNESKSGQWCDATLGEDRDRCIAHTNDFFQYYLGAYIRVEDGGSWNNATGAVTQVVGTSPFPGAWQPENQPDDPSAGAPTSTLASTASLLGADNPVYDTFSEVLAGWNRAEAGPFSPHTGAQYLHSGTDDEAYKRLSRQIQVPADGGELRFWATYDIEQDWDYFFVEASPAGTGQWTTLPDVNGHTAQGTGDSCWDGEGWASLHDRLANYQTKKGDSCTPTGTTGVWNAATGSSNGWQEWVIDLDAYAGQTIDLALVHASDWAVQNLGVWIDDVSLTLGTAPAQTTSFEGTGLDGWSLGPALESSPNKTQWNAAPSTQTFQEGAVIGTHDSDIGEARGGGSRTDPDRTNDTVYAGFEIGSLPDTDRADFLKKSLTYLGVK